jgi:hypothetical protein
MNRIINRANNDYAFSVIQSNDGGFILAGVSATGGIFLYMLSNLIQRAISVEQNLRRLT